MRLEGVFVFWFMSEGMVLVDFFKGTTCGCDCWNSVGHCFDWRYAESFIEGWVCENFCMLEPGLFFLGAEVAGENYIWVFCFFDGFFSFPSNAACEY